MYDIYSPLPRKLAAQLRLGFAPATPPWIGLEGTQAARNLPRFIDALAGNEVQATLSRQTSLRTAVIKIDRRDLPVRASITGRKIVKTGSFSSFKAGRDLPHEGDNEDAILLQSEVDPGVHDFRTQPVEFEFELGGKHRSYVPDIGRQLADGTIEVLEAKTSSDGFSESDYSAKLDRVADICAALGWKFRRVTGQPLRAASVFNLNIEYVCSRRFTIVPGETKDAICRHLSSGNQSLESSVAVCGGGPAGLAIVFALMCRRAVYLDLRFPLAPSSLLSLIPQVPVVEVCHD